VLREDVFMALPVPPFEGLVLGTSASPEGALAVVGAESPAAVCDSRVDSFSADVPSGSVDGLDDAGSLSVADVDAEPAELVDADDDAESAGSANATAGVVATAHPTPSATANAPTRPTYVT
jgi:hypothetical protein